MKFMIDHLVGFLTFSRQDLRGALILCILVLTLLAVPVLFHYLLNGGNQELEYEQIRQWNQDYQKPPAVEVKQKSYYKINMNSSDSNRWVITGLPGYKIRMICHYLEKGGHFRTKADLKKIYCLTVTDYKRLEPHLLLKNTLVKRKRALAYARDKRYFTGMSKQPANE